MPDITAEGYRDDEIEVIQVNVPVPLAAAVIDALANYEHAGSSVAHDKLIAEIHDVLKAEHTARVGDAARETWAKLARPEDPEEERRAWTYFLDGFRLARGVRADG